MANDDEISISPQASQGETVELGSNVELVSDGSGDLKVVASSAVDMNGNQINDSTGAVQMGSDLDANANDVTNVGALNTDDADIGGADFVSSGDFIPMVSFNAIGKRTFSTTATSYTDDTNQFDAQIVWDDFFASDTQTAIWGYALIVPGTNETVDVRLQNVQDGETVTETTGLTGADHVIPGPVNYRPSTTGSRTIFRWQVKNDSGSNATEIRNPEMVIGVQL